MFLEVSSLSVALLAEVALVGRFSVVRSEMIFEVAVLGELLVAAVVQARKQDAVLRGPSVGGALHLVPTPGDALELILL